MPWSSGDAERFKKGLSRSGKSRWAEIANAVLARTGSDSQAIREANGATRASIERRLKKNQTGIGGFGHG